MIIMIQFCKVGESVTQVFELHIARKRCQISVRNFLMETSLPRPKLLSRIYR